MLGNFLVVVEIVKLTNNIFGAYAANFVFLHLFLHFFTLMEQMYTITIKCTIFLKIN